VVLYSWALLRLVGILVYPDPVEFTARTEHKMDSHRLHYLPEKYLVAPADVEMFLACADGVCRDAFRLPQAATVIEGRIGEIGPKALAFGIARSRSLEVVHMKSYRPLRILAIGPEVYSAQDEIAIGPLRLHGQQLDLDITIQRRNIDTCSNRVVWPLVEVPIGQLALGKYDLKVTWHVVPMDGDIPPQPPLCEPAKFMVEDQGFKE
jgi:hypothetical protein